MQDGASRHTANTTMSALRESFGDRLISMKANFMWTLRLPDMNPLDSFLWGYCKGDVYKNKPTNVADLKTEIERFLAETSVEMCAPVIQNFQKMVEQCIQRDGNHFEYRIKQSFSRKTACSYLHFAISAKFLD